ncbi:MAG TPA: UDP-N-acetylglucosamine 2-epimerase (non-hydrolyzing) [Terriglobales bacterium]|nr:UDP-N-acetylglucosamine 2-epimerase (non-hydrolyzing) [Terriglobales bacterium]
MHILHVVGARPNFMKVAPVVRALAARDGVNQTIVHTGQHYDANMSDVFFQELGIPAPDVNLQVGSGSHAQQTAAIISRFEEVVLDKKPGVVLVYGDVNSTVAAALVCAKLGIRVGHVEAGLRSFDRTMPEEINRLLTDQISDLLFTPSEDGNQNLAREGVAPEKVFLVGNVMIDTLVRLLPKAKEQMIPGLPERYALVTLHRPGNVDDRDFMRDMLHELSEISAHIPVLFPIHPRTRQRLADFGLTAALRSSVKLMDPLSYLQFLALQTRAAVVITDSGGIQEETTYLGVPCLTVRENTERPVTASLGTNVLVGRDMGVLRRELRNVVSGEIKRAHVPPLWDGHAAERIADVLVGANALVQATH